MTKAILEKRRQKLKRFSRGWSVSDIEIADDDHPGLILVLRKEGKPVYRHLQVFFGGNENNDNDYGICVDTWEFQDSEEAPLNEEECRSSKGPVVSYIHDLDKDWGHTYNDYLERLCRHIWAKHFCKPEETPRKTKQ